MSATLRLVEVPGSNVKALAGFDDETETTYVLRKLDATKWRLHVGDISDHEQSLRSLTGADQSAEAELVSAIIITMKAAEL